MDYESYLQVYGKKLLYNDTTIKEKRKIGKIDNYTGFSVDILKQIINDCNLFDYYTYEYLVKNKCAHENKSWKVEDRIIVNDDLKHKPNLLRPSVYNLIIFDSDIDYVNKLIELSDGTKIIPKHGKYILFDSREVYRLKFHSETLFNYILIKFY
jgi:hypothetical protein